MEKSAKIINSQLDRASDFKYFALLGAFLFFLDYVLILKTDMTLSEFKYSMLKDEVNLGEIIIFFCLFAFFLSFFVPLIRFLIFWTVKLLIPFDWLYFFYHDSWKNIKPKDYFHDCQLKEYAIKNDNSTAYEYYQSIILLQSERRKLHSFCLAFLLATILNFYAYLINGNALFSVFVVFLDENKRSIVDGIYALPFYALYIFCFYFGVIKGCGISLQDEDKYYMKDHGLKTHNKPSQSDS